MIVWNTKWNLYPTDQNISVEEHRLSFLNMVNHAHKMFENHDNKRTYRSVYGRPVSLQFVCGHEVVSFLKTLPQYTSQIPYWVGFRNEHATRVGSLYSSPVFLAERMHPWKAHIESTVDGCYTGDWALCEIVNNNARDSIGEVKNMQEIKPETSLPQVTFDPKEYPNKCSVPGGCGSPAYLGGFNATKSYCTNPSCKFRDPALYSEESEKKLSSSTTNGENKSSMAFLEEWKKYFPKKETPSWMAQKNVSEEVQDEIDRSPNPCAEIPEKGNPLLEALERVAQKNVSEEIQDAINKRSSPSTLHQLIPSYARPDHVHSSSLFTNLINPWFPSRDIQTIVTLIAAVNLPRNKEVLKSHSDKALEDLFHLGDKALKAFNSVYPNNRILFEKESK